MSYIAVVNPAILSSPGTGIPMLSTYAAEQARAAGIRMGGRTGMTADVFHHAGYSLGIHPACGAARRGGTRPRGDGGGLGLAAVSLALLVIEHGF